MTIDRIIPLFEITSLDHKRYPGVKSRYLTGDTALVNCDLFQLSGLLSSEETRQRPLGIPAIPLSTTSANCVSNTQNNPQNERPAPQPYQPTTQSSNVTYPHTRGVPWKCIDAMIREQVLSGVPLQPPRRILEAKVPPRSGMPGIGQTWLHLKEGRHRIG